MVAVLVLEGESDALAALSAMRSAPVELSHDLAVAAIPGTGYPARRLACELIEVGADEAILALDADEPGRRYAMTAAAELAKAGIPASVVRLPDGTDLADWLADRADRGGFLTAALVAAEAA